MATVVPSAAGAASTCVATAGDAAPHVDDDEDGPSEPVASAVDAAGAVE